MLVPIEMSNTVPGADHAIEIGTLIQRLRKILERPAPIEIANTHETNIVVEISIASAALR